MVEGLNLTLLGSGKTDYPIHPDEAKLETILFNNKGNKVVVRLQTDEFTSLCPITKQPDFGTIYVKYIPKEKLIESKAIKLYFFSFRNVGMFQEQIVVRILEDLKMALSPKYIHVSADFKPRGGIPIRPEAEWGRL